MLGKEKGREEGEKSGVTEEMGKMERTVTEKTGRTGFHEGVTSEKGKNRISRRGNIREREERVKMASY